MNQYYFNMALSYNENKSKGTQIRANYRILCFGEVLWDLLPSGPKVGGAPMNVALHLSKFGFDVLFSSKIGKDKLGDDLRYYINEHGLSTSLLQVDPELPTSTVKVFLGKDNQVSFEIVDQVAWDHIELTTNLSNAAIESNIIIYGTLASRHRYTYETLLCLLENQSIKLIDVNLRPPFTNREVVELLLQRADIAKLNNDELLFIAGWYNKIYNEKDLIQWFAEKYKCSMVCVTKGSKGALIYDRNRILEHPGYQVQVVDTVGAGDAFLAGLVSRYLSGDSLEKSLDFACAVGAFVATKEGATPDYSLDDINLFLERCQNKMESLKTK
jgi:fructokinase